MDMELVDEETNNCPKKDCRKKTWQDLRQEVRSIRRHLSSISSKAPGSFDFKAMYSEGGLNFYRIYFLSTVYPGTATTLLYCDVPANNGPKEVSKSYAWQPFLESSFQTFQPQGRFSREEQLQWERKRVVNWGIASYDFQPSRGRFVFPACGSVFYCDDNGSQAPPFFPHELKSQSEKARLNPQMCPRNSDLVAYVHNNDLWVYNIATSVDVRLTFVKKDASNMADDPISVGMPSYVTQEEFNRYTGYWWQPGIPSTPNMYSILYEEVDEADVEILHLPCYGDDKDQDDYRFPRAGTNNAKSTLKLVRFSVNALNQIDIASYSVLRESLHALCPNYEYLVRVGWTPDGKYVWAVLLNRQQSHEQLVLIPLSAFIPAGRSTEVTANHVDSNSIMQVIYEEESNVWINVNDVLHFFPQVNQDKITFLWASELSGYRHLQIVTVSLSAGSDTDETCLGITQQGLECSLANKVINKKVLTSGEWEVSEQDVWVNNDKKLVFFIGLKDTPLERHLYVVSLEKPEEPIRLTTLGYSHTVAISSDHTLFVSVQSSVSQPPFGQVYKLQYSTTNETTTKVDSHALGYILEPTTINPTYPYPELFSNKLQSGHTIYGMLFKPAGMKPNEKYPTVLTIYGGPEVQLVTNTFKGMRSLRQYLLVSEGYVVVAIDCRGSRHRGVAFESHIKGRMGTVEIADHVEVLLWLSENTGFIDLERVAVHGWSYGGYMSLMALAQRPDIFKVAIAGAPVTSWLLYDTGYTERYMDIPSKNVSGYSKGSVLSYIHQFPDEENRLLIIHGLMDENVHFRHTTQLINALIKAGKPYQLQVYPTERHSLRHLDASEHYEATLLSFLQQHL